MHVAQTVTGKMSQNPIRLAFLGFNSTFRASLMPCLINSSTRKLTLNKAPIYKCIVRTSRFTMVSIICANLAIAKITSNFANLCDITTLESEHLLPLLMSALTCGVFPVGLVINGLYLYWGNEVVFSWNNLLAESEELSESSM